MKKIIYILIFIILISLPVNANNEDVQLKQEFLQASINNQTPLVILALEAGVDVNVKAQNGWTALMNAAGNGNKELVKILIDAGADIKIKSNEENTRLNALMISAIENKLNVAEVLIKNGCFLQVKIPGFCKVFFAATQ